MDKFLGKEPPIWKIKITALTAKLRGIGPDGKEFTIGSLKKGQSPHCNVRLKLLGHGTQSSVRIELRFPRSKTKVTEHTGETQNICINLYADAFENVDEDFTVSQVDELPSFLADDNLAKQSMTRKRFQRVTLRYNPSRIVGEGVEDQEHFSHSNSSAAASLARHLFDQTSSEIEVYAVIAGVKWLQVPKDHMKEESKVIPLGQYYGRHTGRPVIQWGVEGYGPEIDNSREVPVQDRFRNAEQHAITYGYAEMREAGFKMEAALETLKKSVPISLVEIPGYLYKNGMPMYYIGFLDLPDINAVQQLFLVGAKGTACWKQPKGGLQPSGWGFEVKSALPNVEHYGALTLQITRSEHDSTDMTVASRPSSDMLQESNHEVWIFPEVSDVAAQRLVDCASKLLNSPEPKMDEVRRLTQARDLREAAKHGIFEGLTEEQRKRINELTDFLTDDQKEAFEHIKALKHLIALEQGGPGTGKSELACLLIRVFHYLDLPVLALTPTNVAIDVLCSNFKATAPEINAVRFRSPSTDFNAIYNSYQNTADGTQTNSPDTSGLDTKAFEDTLRSMKVILATCSNSADKTLAKCFKPKVIIIDEAAKGKELELLLALVHNVASVVLVIYPGDPLQLPPTVNSRLRTENNEKDGKPVNAFAEQLMVSHMTRLYQIGYDTVVLREQHRMVEGTAIGSSELRYEGLITYSPKTSPSSRPQAQQALAFIKDKFKLATKSPQVCVSASQGIMIRGPKHSRKNLHNIVIDLMIVEEVIRRNIFAPGEITITTPYRDQAAAILTAISQAMKVSRFWKTFDAREIKVFTTDSMQGAENNLIIFDTVLAKKRRGGYGFVGHAGRLNVGVSHHKNMFVLVYDTDCLATDEALAEDDTDDDNALEVGPDTGRPVAIESERPSKLKDLIGIYERAGVVTSVDPSTLPQAKFVDLAGPSNGGQTRIDLNRALFEHESAFKG